MQEKDLEGNLERASELVFELAKRIQSLEQLVREWRNSRLLSFSELNDLHIRTNQLLGEEE
jgi:hypothetical protein